MLDATPSYWGAWFALMKGVGQWIMNNDCPPAWENGDDNLQVYFVRPYSYILCFWILILGRCCVVAKVYMVLYIWYSPPCRAHVHIIQILRARANIHTVLEGQQHVYCILARKQWARKQLLTNPLLCMQYRNTHPSGFALGIRASTAYKPRELANNYYIIINVDHTHILCM